MDVQHETNRLARIQYAVLIKAAICLILLLCNAAENIQGAAWLSYNGPVGDVGAVLDMLTECMLIYSIYSSFLFHGIFTKSVRCFCSSVSAYCLGMILTSIEILLYTSNYEQEAFIVSSFVVAVVIAGECASLLGLFFLALGYSRMQKRLGENEHAAMIPKIATGSLIIALLLLGINTLTESSALSNAYSVVKIAVGCWLFIIMRETNAKIYRQLMGGV